MLKRFSLKFLLLAIAIVAITVWIFDSGYRPIYQESVDKIGTITVLGKRVWNSGKYLVRVEYEYPSGSSKPNHASQAFELNGVKKGQLKFESVYDEAIDVWCIYDTSDRHFVMILEKPVRYGKDTIPFWHPGIHVGWVRGFWYQRFKDLKKRFPEIPYQSLPGEKQLVDEQMVIAE